MGKYSSFFEEKNTGGKYSSFFDTKPESYTSTPLPSQRVQQMVEQTYPVAVPERQEPTTMFGKAADTFKGIAKGGLDFLNSINTAKDELYKKAGNALGNTKFFQEASAGLDVQKKETGKIPLLEKSLTTSSDPILAAINTEPAKLIIRATSEGSKNIPLKTMAAISAIGDETYEQSYARYLAGRNDPNNPTWKAFLYNLQDSGVQSAIGAILALGTSVATRSPSAGYAVSGAYYSALSASEQLDEKGEVTSKTKIAVDTIGDELLSNLFMGAFKGNSGTLKTILKGMLGEGSTEVTQTLLKYADDYAKAKTEEEKNAILSTAKDYVLSGEMGMEFAVGAASGGIITETGAALGKIANPSMQPKRQGTGKKEEKFKKVIEESGIGETVRNALETNGEEEVRTELQSQLGVDEQTAQEIIMKATEPTIPTAEEIKAESDKLVKSIQRESELRASDTDKVVSRTEELIKKAQAEEEEQIAELEDELQAIKKELAKRPEEKATLAREALDLLPAPKSQKLLTAPKDIKLGSTVKIQTKATGVEREAEVVDVRDDGVVAIVKGDKNFPEQALLFKQDKFVLKPTQKMEAPTYQPEKAKEYQEKAKKAEEAGHKEIANLFNLAGKKLTVEKGAFEGVPVYDTKGNLIKEGKKTEPEAKKQQKIVEKPKAKAKKEYHANVPDKVVSVTEREEKSEAEQISALILDGEALKLNEEMGDTFIGAQVLQSNLKKYFSKHIQSFYGKTVFDSQTSKEEIAKILSKPLSTYMRRFDNESEKAGAEKMYTHIQKRFEEITGISVKKPTVSKTEQVEEKPDIVKQALDAREARLKEEGFIEKSSQHLPLVQPLTNPIASHKETIAKLKEGTVKLEEYKKSFENVIARKSDILAEISKLSKDEIAKQYPLGYQTQARGTKKDYIDSAYTSMLDAYSTEEMHSWHAFSETYEESVARVVNNETQEGLEAYAKRRKETIAKRKAEKEEMDKKWEKAYTNPETTEEFRAFIQKFGVEKLTSEQRIKYDEAIALKAKEDTEKLTEQKSLVQGVNAGVSFEIKQTKHTKTGADLFVVTMNTRVDKPTYTQLLVAAKKLGGWYSNYRGTGAIPGFQFKSMEDAQTFTQAGQGETVTTEKYTERQEARKENAVSRLAAQAQALEDSANEELNRDRKTNTAKRAREAGSAEGAALRSLQMAQTMKNLASAVASGQAKFLDGVTARTEVEQMETAINQAKFRELQEKYPDYGEREHHIGEPITDETISKLTEEYLYPSIKKETLYKAKETKGLKAKAELLLKSTPADKEFYQAANQKGAEIIEDIVARLKEEADWYAREGVEKYKRYVRMGATKTPILRAMAREYVTFRGEKKEGDKAKQLERELVGKNVGVDFFPTPKNVAEQMVNMAFIQEGNTVLEPSAGNGNIAEAIREQGVTPDVIEISSELRDVLQAKGFNVVANDFMEYVPNKYDRIIMNPPFSDNQDIKHLQRAYELLNDGGSVVSIVGEGAFFRSGKTEITFRNWLDEVGAEVEQLPAGTFEDKTLLKTTGANGRIVTIQKPENVAFSRRYVRDEIGRFASKIGNLEQERAPQVLQFYDFASGGNMYIQAIKPEDIEKFKDLIDTGDKNKAQQLQDNTGYSYHITATDPNRMQEMGAITLSGYADFNQLDRIADVARFKERYFDDFTGEPLADEDTQRHIIAGFLKRLKYDIPVDFFNEIYTKEKAKVFLSMRDNTAWGAAYGNRIALRKLAPGRTIPHEIVHFTVNMPSEILQGDFGVTRMELLTAVNGGVMPLTEKEIYNAEEKLAEGIEKLWNDEQVQHKGKVRIFLDNLIEYIRNFLNITPSDQYLIGRFYDKVLYAKRKETFKPRFASFDKMTGDGNIYFKEKAIYSKRNEKVKELIGEIEQQIKKFKKQPYIYAEEISALQQRKSGLQEAIDSPKFSRREVSLEWYDEQMKGKTQEEQDKFNASLTEEEQNALSAEAYAKDLKRDEYITPIQKMADSILAGKHKILMQKLSNGAKAQYAEELRTALGKGLYMKLVRTSGNHLPLDVLVEQTKAYNEDYNAYGTSVDDLIDAIVERNEVRKERAQEQAEMRKKARENRKKQIEEAKTEEEKVEVLKGIERDLFKKLTEKRYTVAQYVKAIEKGVSRGVKSIKSVHKERSKQLASVKDILGIEDGAVRSILGKRDYRQMSDKEFDTFLEQVYARGVLENEVSEARIQVLGSIFNLELRNVDNLQKALGFPEIKDMSFQELIQFDKILNQYQQGDVFLGQRGMEMAPFTDLGNIRTYREAREKLAKESGISVAKIEKELSVGEADKFRWDSILYERNAFYRVLVNTLNKAFFTADQKSLSLESKFNALIKSARKSRYNQMKFGDKLRHFFVPTDEIIFNWMEANEEGKVQLAKQMTSEEMATALFMQEYYADVRTYLVENQMLEKGRENYITHIRRSLFEAWKDGGIKTMLSEVFNQYQQDEVSAKILDEKTQEILPLEKFFRFSMKRTGGLVPTKNVARAFLGYAKQFERKRAYDSVLAKIDIYTRVLSPKKETKGGVKMDETLQKFVNNWVNTKKGRRDERLWRSGGKIDNAVRMLDAFLTIKFLGFNVASGLASHVGEQFATYYTLGEKKYAKGLSRLAIKRGREYVKNYEEFVGRTPWDELKEQTQGIPSKVFEFGMFGLFKSGTVRANKVFFLGSLTEEEWNSGEVSQERLAEMKIELGRWRVVEGTKSITGATTLGGVATRFKGWAIVIANRTVKDLAAVSKLLAKGDKRVLTSREFHELLRISITGTLTALIFMALGIDDEYDKDETFLDELLRKAQRDAFSVLQALDPTTLGSVPVMAKWITDMNIALKNLITLEEYKTSKKGEYKKGDLKALPQIERLVVPQILQ